MIETTKTDVSQVIDSKMIVDLPINGRRVDSFVLLTPGVTNDGTFGLLTFRGVAGGNSFLIDGNDATEQFYNENAGRTRIASQISQDAVQEFEVVSTNYSAEYGRAIGGIVNTVTKSGGNQLHGTAYWFFRNRTLDARDPYASFNPPEVRHQTGASIGGPLVKDKLFYFLNVDITRRNYPMVDSISRAGVVDPNAQAFIGCTTPASAAQCQAINAILPRYYGLIPRHLHQELYFGKLDYHFSDRHTFSGSFNFLHEISPNGIQSAIVSTTGSGIGSNGDDAVRVRNGRFSWTYVPRSNFVNEFRWGVATDRQADTFDNSLLAPGVGFIGLTVQGQTGLGGGANYLPRVEPNETRNQFVDNASWTKGRHIIKFGADIATTRDYTYFIQNAFGVYTYQTVTNFALDFSGNTTGVKHWQSFAQTFGNPVVDATINDYGFYLEDQWRATSKLTVNIGARYEYAQLPQPNIINPDFPQTGHISTGNLNLAPRLGIAYQLTDKTVLRAGYGMFHSRFIGSLIDNLYTGNGVYQTAITLNGNTPAQLAAGPVYPNTLGAQPTGANISASNIQFAAPNLKTPYSEQGTVAIERQFRSDIALTASYIWSRGVQLFGVRDLNLPTTTKDFTYIIADANGNQTGSYTTPVYIGQRPNTKYGGINQDENGVNSYYNALTVQARKRFSHGFLADLSYTWAHEIDDCQCMGGSALFFSNAFSYTKNGNYRFDLGSGQLDQRHRFVLSWVWAPTFTHRDGAFFKYVVNNWQLSNITTLASGRPFTASISLKDTPVPGMFSTFSIDGSGLGSRPPFLPVDSLYTPASYRADARLSKVIPISDRVKLYLMFEVFNLSNSWSPTNISTQVYSEAKGVLTLTPGAFGVGTGDGGFPDGTQARREQVAVRFVF
jgi:hypothetical protein